ncbi:MAG: 16S rRNA (cytosine(1402)-N(4))-methyltransferase RsmH [Rhodothermaceae bacterium]|nr:16S rRNA (cytosine(1402)-N(4))-methyltransferase RsmH [Rhodothermaceae bacterium]
MARQSPRPQRHGKRVADEPVSPSADSLRYASDYHAPVLAREVVEGLVTNPSGVYVDGTLGGGGHAAALLDALGPDALVVGIDQDADALTTATERLFDDLQAGRFRALRGNFADMEALLADAGLDAVDGVLLDLGISSHQIDEAARGFAFSADGPLDMRMNAAAPETAADLINTLDVQALTDLLRAYGEEPRAWPIANAIVEQRPLATTGDLADAVRSAVPTREEVKTLARVFQALRIAVNDEIGVLERVLGAALRVLKPGGRLAVIAYHSLEDRPTKHFLRFGNLEGEARKDFFGNLLTPFTLLTRKPLTASAAEVAANPRARSARLRIAEKKPDRPPEPS